MNHLSTHVLDTSRGRPAAKIVVTVDRLDSGGGWTQIAQTATDADGRIARLADVSPGEFRLTFATADYFRTHGMTAFYPEVVIRVRLEDAKYHLPLLLSPYGYSTYRGS